MRSIDLIVIHCSASPNGVWISPEQIDRWHREAGFKRSDLFARRYRPQLPHIGYHRVILANGQIAFGRELEEVGAHVAGHNARSVGICMVGINAYFLAQWAGLRECLGALVVGLAKHLREPLPESWLPIPSREEVIRFCREHGIRICGHRDLSPDKDGDGRVEPHEWLKTCPGFDVADWLDRDMQPEAANVLDDHPAIGQASGLARAMSSMRYGI